MSRYYSLYLLEKNAEKLTRERDRESLEAILAALRGGKTAKIEVELRPGHVRSVTVPAELLGRALATLLARDRE